MREILFRGKRVDNGEWVYGWYCGKTCDAFFAKARESAEIIEEDTLFWHEVIPETVGQFTGLTDENGTKIFEGDIVHYVYEPGEGFWNANQKCIIEWRNTGFFLNGIKGTNKYACMSGWLVSIPHGDGKTFEVIGNIHDNPEGVQ